MFRKYLMVSVLIVTGCNDTMDNEKATTLINLKNEDSCLYISLSPDDIQYNTSTRTYSINDKTIRVSTSLESFSIPEKADDEKHLNQLIVLEREGMVKQVADYVTPTEPDLYVTDVEGAPTELKDVSRVKGVQYRLTKLGKKYFSTTPNSPIPRVCVGHEKVQHLLLNDLSNDQGELIATYTVKVEDIPDWVKTPTVKNAFPIIEDRIRNTEAEQKTATFVKESHHYILSEE